MLLVLLPVRKDWLRASVMSTSAIPASFKLVNISLELSQGCLLSALRSCEAYQRCSSLCEGISSEQQPHGGWGKISAE